MIKIAYREYRMSAPTRDMLMARVYRHVPRGIRHDDPRHRASEESRRLACVQEAAAIACGKGFVPVPAEERVAIDPEVLQVVDALRAWRHLGERCKQAFPDREVWDESGPFFDPGYRYTVGQADYVPPPRAPLPGRGEPPVERAPQPGQHGVDTYDPVVCVVSVLAPVFVILTITPAADTFPRVRYADFPERYQDRIDTLGTLVQEVLGFARLDEDTLLTPMPDLQPHTSNRPMSETTLGDCLFTAFY
jgi:hypothetical protein